MYTVDRQEWRGCLGAW